MSLKITVDKMAHIVTAKAFEDDKLIASFDITEAELLILQGDVGSFFRPFIQAIAAAREEEAKSLLLKVILHKAMGKMS